MKIKMNMTRQECLFKSSGIGWTLETLNKGQIIVCDKIEEYKGKYTYMNTSKLFHIILSDGRYYSLTSGVFDVIPE